MNNQVPIYIAGNKGHVFLCLHGAGLSALSFATFAKHMKSQSIVVSFDFRGHGGHHCENETDMSEQVLIHDTLDVLKHVSTIFPEQSIILVGHSMGGSIATKTADIIHKEH